MSQFVGELCALLIDDTYGSFYSHIFTTLLEHGRLTLTDLGRHCSLPSRNVRQGIAALIQSHLVYYYTLPIGQTFYSANWESAYNLIRTGKIMSTVEDRLGKYAASVLMQILLLGHAEVSHLASLPALVNQATKGMPNGQNHKLSNGISGVVERVSSSTATQDRKHTIDDLLTALQQLADANFIQKVRSSHFHNATDNRDDAEQLIHNTHVMINNKGKKMQEELASAVDGELRRQKESLFAKSTFQPRPLNGSKRFNDTVDDSNPPKRMKLNNDTGEDLYRVADADVGPSGNLVVQVNHPKFLVLMRNQRLFSLAERRLGRTTARVYREALQQTEHEIFECRSSVILHPAGAPSDYPTTLVDVENLARNLNPKIHLEGSIARLDPRRNERNGLIHQSTVRRIRPPDHGRPRHDDGDENDEVDEYGNISGIEHDSEDEEGDRAYNPLTNSRRPRTNGFSTNGNLPSRDKVFQHLYLLAEAPEGFITCEKEDSVPYWRIDFEKLCSVLRNEQVFSLILDLFGAIALRIVRVLIEKGKLEEKVLQEIALVSAKDLRLKLAELKAAGFLELQEVPRENQRQPSRTIYLWFYDPDRVRRKVLEDTYKSMSRVLQRLSVEKKKVQGILDKADRSDVKGHEEEYLSGGETRILKEWRALEEKFWGEVGRLDDLVAVLRDF